MGDTAFHTHNGQAYPLKRATLAVTAASTVDIVLAVTGKSIIVVGAWFSAAATTTFQFVDNATPGGPVLTIPAANCWNPPHAGAMFESTSGNKLAGVSGAGAAVTGWVWYIEV